MNILIGVVGLALFLLLAWLPSSNRQLAIKKLPWVGLMLVIQLLLGLLFLKTPVGENVVNWIADGFDKLLEYSWSGTSFVFGDLVGESYDPAASVPFLLSVLMPIIFISALIGILRYIKVLPVIINGLGWALSKVNGMGRLESYNAVASAMIGQSEVFISIKQLLPAVPKHRMYTLAASAMSTVSMSIVGAYMTMIDPRYVVAAIIMNLFGGFIVVSLINPYEVTPEEEVLPEPKANEQSFFEMLGEYIMDGAKVALTVAAMLIGFVALIAMLNGIFAGIFNGTTFQVFLGHIFAPLAFMTGVPWDESVDAGNLMATKLVSNEFVAMLDFSGFEFSERSAAIIQTFLVSFANFSSIGIIAGAVKSLSAERGKDVASFGLKLLYGASLVSFISATIVGLITW